MMILVYLKDIVFTTQSSTNIIDSKPEITKLEYFYEKRVCFALLVGRGTIVQLVSKERVFPAWCCTKQTKLEGSNFLKWASFAPTEYYVTYLPSDCPS